MSFIIGSAVPAVPELLVNSRSSPFSNTTGLVMVRPAFVSYETPLAPCGGIAAVLGRLPAEFKAASQLETVVFTPFHHRIEKTRTQPTTAVGSFRIPFDGRTLGITVLRSEQSVPYYFIATDDPQIFAGERHPYDVGAGLLLRDALVFGAAVARALPTIAIGERWTLMLQDWETATVAMSLAGQPGGHRCFLTLHNSYDQGCTLDDLWRVDISPHACPGTTVLQRAIGVCRSPVFTVSGQFAGDLTGDLLQAQVLAPQLQTLLRGRVMGVDNGPFVDQACPDEIVSTAATNVQPLLEWKRGHRRSFLAALDALPESEDRPVWGNRGDFNRDDAPWFVMAGRDDARQKGYDVAAAAVRNYLLTHNDSRFLFFPMPGDEGRAGLDFLQNLAEDYPKNVMVFPFMFREGFMAALRGATFGMMPSLYEPFGMANEFYLNGTVGIGRATGGIVQQLVPLRNAACFGRSVETRTQPWHGMSAAPTGLLFRERDQLPGEAADWAAINAAAYTTRPGIDRVTERMQYGVFRSLAHELRVAIGDASSVALQNPALYGRMLCDGVKHVRQSFSWPRAANEYARYVL